MSTKIHYLDPDLVSPQHPITISLIGCGGTGSSLLTQLARIHTALRDLRHPGLFIKVFDPDTVSVSNIGRQLFSIADLDSSKAIVLISRINRHFGTNWKAYPRKMTTEEIKSNIVITCIDTVQGRRTIHKQLKAYIKLANKKKYDTPYQLKYWMDCGNSRDTGQVVLGTLNSITQPKKSKFDTQGKMKHFFDLFPEAEQHETKKDQGPTCSVAEALMHQNLFVNSTIAQYAANLTFKLLNDKLTAYNGLFVNTADFKSQPIKL